MVRLWLRKPRVMQLREVRNVLGILFCMSFFTSVATWVDTQALPRTVAAWLGTHSVLTASHFDQTFGWVVYCISDAFLYAYWGMALFILVYRLFGGWHKTTELAAQQEYTQTLRGELAKSDYQLNQTITRYQQRQGWHPLAVDPLDRDDVN